MPEMVILPVVNGFLPRPGGGSLKGILLEPRLMRAVLSLGPGGDVLVAPVPAGAARVYEVGVVAKILNVYTEPVFMVGEESAVAQGVFVELEGRFQARVQQFSVSKHGLRAAGINRLNLKEMRPAYPVISGAGWQPLGGVTETRARDDITVCVYGTDSDEEMAVAITASLGGVVSAEEAHTVEHAIIRSLKNYGLCSPKTLVASWQEEAEELKASLEAGFRYGLPELFGVTATGSCGNPLSNLAEFYLAEEFLENMRRGDTPLDSLQSARLKTLSKLSSQFEISSNSGLRVLQGLKRGMKHTDIPTLQAQAHKILNRFPTSPWD
jgi:hypothetical protein